MVSEILWVRCLLCGLGQIHNNPTLLFCDNQAAIHIANYHVYYEMTKHMEMDCYFVRDLVDSNVIRPMNIKTKNQNFDLFTKGLGSEQLKSLLDKVGV